MCGNIIDGGFEGFAKGECDFRMALLILVITFIMYITVIIVIIVRVALLA